MCPSKTSFRSFFDSTLRGGGGGGGTFLRGPIPFRFENMWLKAEGFKELVNSWWHRLSFSG